MCCLALLKSPNAFISYSWDFKLAENYPHLGHIFPFPGKYDGIWPSYSSLLNPLVYINCVFLQIRWSLTAEDEINVHHLLCMPHWTENILLAAPPCPGPAGTARDSCAAAAGRAVSLCSCTQCPAAPVSNAEVSRGHLEPGESLTTQKERDLLARMERTWHWAGSAGNFFGIFSYLI